MSAQQAQRVQPQLAAGMQAQTRMEQPQEEHTQPRPPHSSRFSRPQAQQARSRPFWRQKPLSPQARFLRKKVIGRLLCQLLACALVGLVAIVLLDRLAAGPVGTALANAAEWHIFQPGSAEEETRLQAFLESQPNAVWDVQQSPLDHTIWVRDLALYYFVKAAWLPGALCLMFAVMLGFTLLAFRRVCGLVDNLSGAVANLLANEAHPVTLPPELAITAAELEKLRQESLARKAAAEAEQKRTQELMAYLVHDVRTPLTAVIGSLSLLEEAPLTTEAHAQTTVALARSLEMEQLTSDLFVMTRLALDPESVVKEAVDLHLLTLQVVEELAITSEITFATPHCPEALPQPAEAPLEPVVVLGDPDLLAKALEHLIKTALALAAPAAHIAVDGSAQDGMVRIETCVPTASATAQAAKELVACVFEPYYQLGSSSGVSLAFAREIAHAHNGNITACARGTTIVLTLWLPTHTH